MLDFTSSLYLGMAHPRDALRPWAGLTTGRPAALGEPPGAAATAARLARLQGREAAVLATSTLHLFWDLGGMLDGSTTTIYLDDGAYPVARWGAERAAARGVAVRPFPHHDAAALRRMLAGEPRAPLVIADGFCPSCGRSAPLGAYLEAARARDGRLLADDTQALGVLGAAPGPGAPYGAGGGGSAAHLGLAGPGLLLASSLAKGFGSPLAALSGAAAEVRMFVERSETRVHSSPPSQAAIAAAWLALERNAAEGEALRARLWRLVRRLRRRAARAGLELEGGAFPVQTLAPKPGVEPRALAVALGRLGVRAVLRRGHGGGPRLSLIVTAAHTPSQIDRAVLLLRAAVALGRRRAGREGRRP
ncbi:MAG TPA: aminotransferase class I/II-fold pyridoxal phosphate-dependent enzyme [Chloroflexaceae bacterium]|nr:aminotransferase class I/II-fold pyridoxal phosphate-dependent enzyme [Chloroflexaceae bacterium]